MARKRINAKIKNLIMRLCQDKGMSMEEIAKSTVFEISRRIRISKPVKIRTFTKNYKKIVYYF